MRLMMHSQGLRQSPARRHGPRVCTTAHAQYDAEMRRLQLCSDLQWQSLGQSTAAAAAAAVGRRWRRRRLFIYLFIYFWCGGVRICFLLVSLFMSKFSISVSSPVGICINCLWRRQQVADLPYTQTDEKQHTIQANHSTSPACIYIYLYIYVPWTECGLNKLPHVTSFNAEARKYKIYDMSVLRFSNKNVMTRKFQFKGEKF